MEWKWPGRLGSAAVLILFCLLVSLAVVSSDRSIGIEGLRGTKSVQEEDMESNYVAKLLLFLWQTDKNSYKPVWPVNFLHYFSGLVGCSHKIDQVL